MDVPYLLRGVMPVETDSSVLVASSKYLADPRLRDWVATILLRKNGADFPPHAEMHPLIGILDALRDHARIEQMFSAERKVNPALERWFEDAVIPPHKIEDFRDCPPGSVGRICHEQLGGQYETR